MLVMERRGEEEGVREDGVKEGWSPRTHDVAQLDIRDDQ